MIFDDFQRDRKHLIVSGVSQTGNGYHLYFDIATFKGFWEEEGITLNDLLDKKAYCLMDMRRQTSRPFFFKR